MYWKGAFWNNKGFGNDWALGKLTGCEDDFAQLI